MELTSIFHLWLTLFIPFYGFIIKKNWIDLYYLILIFGIGLSWTFYGGDCPISYYYKKKKNPSYHDVDFKVSNDLHVIFGKKYEPFLKQYHRFIINVLTLISILSVYCVMKRQSFPMISIFILLFIYATYYVTIINNMNYHFLFCPLLIGCLIYIISVWK